jgi:serine/threonine protein kinase
LLQNAVTLFSQASEADPKSADSTRNLAATYAKFARLCTDANKRDEYYKHCCDYYKRAYELDKNNRDLMFGWANALFRQAASWREDVPQKNDKTIIALLLQAAVKYSHSLQTPGPFFREAYINLGSVLLLVLRLNKRQVISLLGMKEYQKDFHDCACSYLEMENKHISSGSMRDFPYEDRILKLLSECDDLIIKSKASQVLSTLQPVEKKTAPMESVDEGKEFIISPRSPPLSFDRQEMSSLSQTVKRTEIDDAPKPVGSIISAAYLSPLARKKAKRKSNEAIRKGSDSPSSFKVTTSGSLGRATTRQWRSRSVPDALPNIFNLPSTGSDSSLVKGDKDRDREKESKDKEPKEKEKKRHRRLSIRRRARKSSEGLVKQPLTPVEIDWDQCVLYSYSIENMKLKKISESDLKIENIIGRHRYGMIFQVKWQSKEYVLKIFPKSSNILSNGLLVFKTPYLVKTEVIFHDETKIYYLFEAIKGVKFIQFIQETCKEKKLKEDMMMFYAQELFTIFECLEDCGFICRDFKSHNILLRDDGHLVSTVFWESNTDKSFSNAAISLLSPEIIKRLRSKQRSDSADIKKQTDYEDHVSMWWSFGVFLYICLVGKHPFKNDKNELREELMQKRKLPLPSDLSKACRSLIRELLEPDPKKRLCSASAIKKHAFFSGCDWDNAKRSKNKPPLMPKVKAIPSYLTVPANTQLTASSGSMTNSESENSLDSSSSTINMQQPIGMTMFAPDASNLLEGFTVVVPSDDIDDV